MTEIIIILGIVGIIISAILPLFVNIIAAGQSAAYYSTAYKIADSKIEHYRNTNFDLVMAETIPLPDLPGGQIISQVTHEVDGINEPEIKRIELDVTWKEKRQREIKIVTYIYRGGL